VRHKALDCVGILASQGDVFAQVVAHKPSHEERSCWLRTHQAGGRGPPCSGSKRS
jgi:hypothetical protein